MSQERNAAMVRIARTEIRWVVLLAFASITCGSQARQDEVVRKPAVAGTFYTADAEQLAKNLDKYLRKASSFKQKGRVVGLIVPHAGYQYSAHVAAKGFRAVQGQSYQTVVVIAPSHVEGFPFSSVFNGDAYQTPLGKIEVDKGLVADIVAENSLVRVSEKGHLQSHLPRQEHSLEVELPFLQRALKPGFRLVPIVMGIQSYKASTQLGNAISRACKNRNVLVVASTDLSHFHPHQKAVELDKIVIESVKEMNYFKLAQDIDKGRCEACGAGPMIATMVACEKMGAARSMVVAYATSGDVPPYDKQRVVGYMAAVLTTDVAKLTKSGKPMELTQKDKRFLLELARQTIKARTADKSAPSAQTDASVLNTKCGAFVTLHKRGQLRGCIGYIEAYKPLSETIVDMAESASLRDPRFPAVAPDEVDDLDIEISVLSPLETITDVNTIQVGVHGLVMERGANRGLLLPQVATEQGWDRDTFLAHTCLKAGLPPDAWRDKNTTIKIFSAVVFGEKELKD